MAEYIVYYSVEDTDELMPYKRERIVRCRNCRHHFVEDEVTSMRYGDDMCGYWATDHGTHTDGFCAWGEPKEAMR